MKIDVDFADSIVKLAIKRGADLAEVYQKSSKSISADSKNSAPDFLETSSSYGYSLRIIKDQRLGFSYSNSRDDVSSVLETALDMTKVAERDITLDLPDNITHFTEPDIFDESVHIAGETVVFEAARGIEESSRSFDTRITKVRKASAEFQSSQIHITNSRGVSAGYNSTLCSGIVMAIAEENGDGQMGWGYEVSRFSDDIFFKRVGHEAAQRAVRMLGARKIRPVKAPVLLDGGVSAEFLSVFASMLSSEMVQKNKSLLSGKKGQKIVSDIVSLVDDALLPHAPGTRPVDDEGVPVQKKDLINNGILLGYLYNTHTAKKEGVKSTGNGLKVGISSVPGVRPVNLMVRPSSQDKATEDILKEMHKGLFVTEAMGTHTVNPVSGHFSIGVSGIWVENGEMVHPVKESVISGNLLEFFGKVEIIGADTRLYGNIGSSGILFNDTDISG